MGVVSVLVAWGCLAVGFVIGWLLGRTDWANRKRGMSTVPTEPPSARGRHHALTTEMPIVTDPDHVVLADTARDTPVPRRRADDLPGAQPTPPLPGGRRRSDGPRQTRRSASQLASGQQGAFGRFGPDTAESPDSP